MKQSTTEQNRAALLETLIQLTTSTLELDETSKLVVEANNQSDAVDCLSYKLRHQALDHYCDYVEVEGTDWGLAKSLGAGTVMEKKIMREALLCYLKQGDLVSTDTTTE